MHKVLYSDDDEFNLTSLRAITDTNTTINDSEISGQKLAVIATLACLSLFGCLGNGLVILVYGRIATKKDSSKIFILALACIDMFACLVIMPFTATYLYLNVQLQFDGLCKLYQFLITSDIPLSAFLMVTIAFDRYFNICHPFLRLVTPKRAKIALAFPFVTACCLGSINSLSHGVYTYETITRYVDRIESGYTYNTSRIISFNTHWIPEGCNKKLAEPISPVEVPVALCANSTNEALPAVNINNVQTETVRVLVYTDGYCIVNNIWYSKRFYWIFQKIYASFFLISFLVVLALYLKIYRFVARHRFLRSAQMDQSHSWDSFELDGETSSGITQAPQAENLKSLPIINKTISISLVCHPVIGMWANRQTCKQANKQVGSKDVTDQGQTGSTVRSYFKKMRSLQDARFAANVRTASMLAVVAFVFMFCFLPSWLMATKMIPLQMNVFYLYFLYNVANPIIYAFMNPKFRKELKLMLGKYYSYKN